MKEFNQVTKVLKRCWKEKVTITTATVVAFLMGANVYAKDVIIPEKEIPEIQKGQNIEITIADNITLTKGIRTVGNDKAGNVKIINNGNINFNITEEDAQKTHLHGMRIYGEKVDIVNNGNIVVTKEDGIDKLGNGVIGIEVGSSQLKGAKVINNGLIKTVNTAKDIHSIGAGLVLTSSTIGVNNGKIEVVGNGIGVRTNGEFLNSGIIDISQSTLGVAIKVQDGGKALNEGTVILNLNDTTSAILNQNGTAVNSGKIKINNKTIEELKEFDIYTLFKGQVANKGMLVDKDGKIVKQYNETLLEGEYNLDKIQPLLDSEYSTPLLIDTGISATFRGQSKPLNFKGNSLNIAGKLNIKSLPTMSGKLLGVVFDDSTINLDNSGIINIGINNDKGSLTLINSTVNGKEKSSDFTFETNDSELTLNNSNVNANIGNSTDLGIVNTLGNTIINGTINVKDFNIGNVTAKAIGEKTNKTTFTSTSKIEAGTTINIAQDGQMALQLGTKGENALNNSTGVTVNGDGIKDNGDIILDTANVTGKGMTVSLGNNTIINADVTTTSGKNGVYVASDIKTGTDGVSSVEVKYNNSLFEDGKTNAVNNAAMNTNDIFENTDLNVRKQQMEKIYYSNIFAKTVKASYTGVKLVEDKISDLPTTAEVGKWTAMGTGLYNVNKNKEHGFENKIETSGLVASMEYGLNPSTSVGVALSGAYQDVKAATGKADGELMYVGTYAKKEYGPYKLIAGLGYQYGRYKTDNTTGYVSSSNKYSTNTFSTYVEGRYTMNVGDAVSFEPKLKLGYTYVDQEDAKDSYIGMSDANLSTFDTEVGADLVKTIAIENGKVDMTFGASYVRAMGDTDKEFTGEFAKSNGTFDIVGANLAKNTGKFDLSVKVTKDSGIFYKGGVTYQVGSDKTRDYGVNIGLGYKF